MIDITKVKDEEIVDFASVDTHAEQRRINAVAKILGDNKKSAFLIRYIRLKKELASMTPQYNKFKDEMLDIVGDNGMAFNNDLLKLRVSIPKTSDKIRPIAEIRKLPKSVRDKVLTISKSKPRLTLELADGEKEDVF
tara:strand:- start:5 stop:415 length:411 start_codon:yes stop_codon:yes gene_type:complete